MPFVKGGPNPAKKGHTNNPGGRTKGQKAFLELAREATDELVIDAWVREVRTSGPDWLQASKLLAAYAYGQPSNQVQVTGHVSGAVKVAHSLDLESLSAKQLEAIRPAVKSIEETLAADAPKPG